jgi:uncharacterized OsmC-like protein
MTNPARIRQISERNVKLLSSRPNRGHLTGVTKARIEAGLRCAIEEGPWRLASDMPAKAGGEETAPTPGMLGRGALASCLAMGIMMWAARLEIPIDNVEVEVQADFDARGELGIGDVRAGYREVRHVVNIDSPAPSETLLELLETAERHSPYLDVFGRAQAMRRVLRLNGTEV